MQEERPSIRKQKLANPDPIDYLSLTFHSFLGGSLRFHTDFIIVRRKEMYLKIEVAIVTSNWYFN